MTVRLPGRHLVDDGEVIVWSGTVRLAAVALPAVVVVVGGVVMVVLRHQIKVHAVVERRVLKTSRQLERIRFL